MGKRCIDTECPYLAEDGTCLLVEYDLKEKCPARERDRYEEKGDWISEDYVKERFRLSGVCHECMGTSQNRGESIPKTEK